MFEFLDCLVFGNEATGTTRTADVRGNVLPKALA